MASHLKLGVAQVHTLSTTAETLSALARTAQLAAEANVDLLLFPEAYLGGYPRGANFGCAIGSRTEAGREQFRRYFRDAVDLGDTPRGGGADWVHRRIGSVSDDDGPESSKSETAGHRGDGTRERLEQIAKDTGVFLVTGLVERAGGSLYCAVAYVHPQRGCMAKRRKIMPTGVERLVWAQGSPSTLRAIKTVIKGVEITLAAAICWENYMPLLRASLYSQNVNIYLAPTADPRDTWVPLMQTIALEGRAFVLSANQCIRESELPTWIQGDLSSCGSHSTDLINERESTESEHSGKGRRRQSVTTKTELNHEITWPAQDPKLPESSDALHEVPREQLPTQLSDDQTSSKKSAPFASRGGSCIISPSGKVLAGPLWENTDGILTVVVDLEDCIRGRLDFDCAGSYSRNDSFELKVQGLDLSPP